MKKHGLVSKMLSTLLVLAMMPVMPIGVGAAAAGEYSIGSTGLTTDGIDVNDTISLPVEIFDYEADGLMFEYADISTILTPADFGVTYVCDYTNYGSSNKNKFAISGYENSTLSFSLENVGDDGQYLHVEAGYNNGYDEYFTRFNAYYDDGAVNANKKGSYDIDSIRYMVLVYRYPESNGHNAPKLKLTRYNSGTGYQNEFFVNLKESNNWTADVVDIKPAGYAGKIDEIWMGADYCIYNPYTGEDSNVLDLAYIAYFNDEGVAQKFAEYAITKGSDNGDNKSLGLLRGSASEHGNGEIDKHLWGTGVVDYIASYGASDSKTVHQLEKNNDRDAENKNLANYNVGYGMRGSFQRGIANIGLLKSTLSEKGYPVYKEGVVRYFMYALDEVLQIPEYNSEGWKNYRYAGSVLADKIRAKLDPVAKKNFTQGSYAETVAKADQLVGVNIDAANIKTVYDAAYYLLHNTFIENTYNVPQKQYKYLVLSAATDTEGNEVYVFDGGFTQASASDSHTVINVYGVNISEDISYDNGIIQNRYGLSRIRYHYSKSDGDGTDYTTNAIPFLPPMVDADGNPATVTNTKYYQDEGVIADQDGTKTIENRNYGYAMVSEGEFIYHSEDELFFEFEGDDDVYLFINDELVMDLGGVHSVSKTRFEVNDYVLAAKANALGSEERNTALNLKEGQLCSFKFFYMERHTYGANFRIETNIRVTDPEMTTEKLAWQSGTQLDYGSVVDATKQIEYGFSITNTGSGVLSDFTFTDSDIGVKLDGTDGFTRNGSVLFNFNLTVITTDIAGNDVISNPNNKNSLTSALKSGIKLNPGETITIRGIYYDLPANINVFDNTVLSSAVATVNGENTTLYGRDTMRVYIPNDPIYYQWAGNTLQVAAQKVLSDIFSVENSVSYNYQLSDINGKVKEYPYVHWTDADDLLISYPDPGIQMFYISFYDNYNNRLSTVPVFVNVADVEDSTIVLDYGLPVNISVNELTKNDAVDIFGSKNTWSIIGFGNGGKYNTSGGNINQITFTDVGESYQGKYGNFEINSNNSITYTPNGFIEGEDSIQIAVNVYDTSISPSNITGTLNINREVEMYKTIRIVPANVMYYENDFDGIEYLDTAVIENNNTETNIYLQQSDDQDMNYGYDPQYAAASNNETSLGSMHKILLDSTEDFSFTFVGTGFELIGRTNAKDTGTIIAKKEDGTAGASETGETHNMPAEAQLEVEVVTTYPAAESAYSMSGETMFTSRKIYPVIMEFDNGNDGGDDEICQVPVLRIDGLNYGTHTVTVTGVQAYEWDGSTRGDPISTYFYFDGLRIYQPLGDDDTHYNKYEKDAKFEEIRDLIIDGEAAVASYDESLEISKIGTGNHVITWTENLNEDYEKTDEAVKDEVEINTVDSVDDYLIKGPNNEVYMLDNETSGVDSGIFFFVKEPSPETKVGTPSLQVAVRAIDFGKFIGTGSTQTKVRVQYNALDANGNYAWTDLVPAKEIVTGTELYYDIDYTKCPKDENSETYMVALRVYSDAAANNYMASYTSLKLTGGLSIATEWEYNSNGFVYDSGSNNETTYSAEYTTSENLYNTVAYAMIEQLKSDIIITSSDAGSTPEIDDPFQNLPDDTNDSEEEEESSKPSNFDLLKLFTLTAIAGEGGTITPEGDLIIAFGASRTFKFIPDEGYEIADVLVNGKSVGAVEKYVLKAAHADTVVEVLFREIPEAAADAEAAAEEAAG